MWNTIPAWRYLWKISAALPGSRKQKKQILARVKASVLDYAEQNPYAGYNDFVSQFGNPQQIAESCIEEMSPSELLQSIDTRSKVVTIILVAVFVSAMVWFSVALKAYHNHRKNMNGYATVEIIVLDETVFDEGGK